MLQRVSNENKIDFLNKEKKKEDKVQQQSQWDGLKSLFSNAPSKEPADLVSGGSTILSAGKSAGQKDEKHSGAFIGMNTNNTIYEPEKLKTTPKDSKELTKAEVAKIADVREQMKQDRIAELVQNLENVDTRKASEVTSFSPSKVKDSRPKRAISIFDAMEGKEAFADVPTETQGEKVSKEARMAKAKDESWKRNGKAITSKGILDKLFDQLTQGKESDENS